MPVTFEVNGPDVSTSSQLFPSTVLYLLKLSGSRTAGGHFSEAENDKSILHFTLYKSLDHF